VFVPQRQRVLVKTSRQLERIETIREHRIFPEELAADPGRYLLHLPSSAVGELVLHGVLDHCSLALWSMWDGYLAEPSGLRLTRALAASGVPFRSLHTSGHASVPDLKRLVDALAPGQVVPIHTDGSDRFSALFERVTSHPDGAWWAA
jgi:ribonuclease J